MQPTVASACADFLATHGVLTVFTLPGSSCLALLDAMARRGIEIVLCAEETAAVHAAHGYAAADGERFGCCVVSRGPGALHAVAGIAAGCEGFPVLLLVGDNPSAVRGTGTVSQDAPLGPVFEAVAPCRTLCDPACLHDLLAEALQAMRGPRQSFVLILPSDLQPAGAGASPISTRPTAPAPFAGNRAAPPDALLDARSPFVLIGAGVAREPRAASAVARLVERCPGVPCAVTFRALRFPLDRVQGIVGIHGDPHANRLLYESDLVVVLDECLSAESVGTVDAFKRHRRIVSVHVTEPRQRLFDPDCTAWMDVQGLESWLERTGRVWASRPPAARAPAVVAPATGIGGLLGQIYSLLPASCTAVCLDSGQNFFWGARALTGSRHCLPILSFIHAPMGFAVPAAIGAACRLQAPVLAVTGDGGLMMCLGELHTAAGLGLPVKVVLINNQGLGMVRQTQMMRGIAPVAVSFAGPDWKALAAGFGITHFAARADDVMDDVLPAFVATPGPTLLEVAVDPRTGLDVRGSTTLPLPT